MRAAAAGALSINPTAAAVDRVTLFGWRISSQHTITTAAGQRRSCREEVSRAKEDIAVHIRRGVPPSAQNSLVNPVAARARSPACSRSRWRRRQAPGRPAGRIRSQASKVTAPSPLNRWLEAPTPARRTQPARWPRRIRTRPRRRLPSSFRLRLTPKSRRYRSSPRAAQRYQLAPQAIPRNGHQAVWFGIKTKFCSISLAAATLLGTTRITIRGTWDSCATDFFRQHQAYKTLKVPDTVFPRAPSVRRSALMVRRRGELPCARNSLVNPVAAPAHSPAWS